MAVIPGMGRLFFPFGLPLFPDLIFQGMMLWGIFGHQDYNDLPDEMRRWRNIAWIHGVDIVIKGMESYEKAQDFERLSDALAVLSFIQYW